MVAAGPLPDELLAAIKLLATDVDGVLTDGGMYYSENGDELKKFNTRDGMGLSLLRQIGIKIAFITTENTKLVERRAKKLRIDDLHQGVLDKAAVVDELAMKYKLSKSEIAYVGDDINDIGALKAAGVAFSVADGAPQAKELAHYVTAARGGEGAIREISTLILEAKKVLSS